MFQDHMVFSFMSQLMQNYFAGTSLLSQENGWEERLRKDLFGDRWDVKLCLNQLVQHQYLK